MVSIVTEGSDDVKGSDSSPLPPVSPPALETLILSDCRIGNATTEQVSHNGLSQCILFLFTMVPCLEWVVNSNVKW